MTNTDDRTGTLGDPTLWSDESSTAPSATPSVTPAPTPDTVGDSGDRDGTARIRGSFDAIAPTREAKARMFAAIMAQAQDEGLMQGKEGTIREEATGAGTAGAGKPELRLVPPVGGESAPAGGSAAYNEGVGSGHYQSGPVPDSELDSESDPELDSEPDPRSSTTLIIRRRKRQRLWGSLGVAACVVLAIGVGVATIPSNLDTASKNMECAFDAGSAPQMMAEQESAFDGLDQADFQADIPTYAAIPVEMAFEASGAYESQAEPQAPEPQAAPMSSVKSSASVPAKSDQSAPTESAPAARAGASGTSGASGGAKASGAAETSSTSPDHALALVEDAGDAGLSDVAGGADNAAADAWDATSPADLHLPLTCPYGSYQVACDADGQAVTVAQTGNVVCSGYLESADGTHIEVDIYAIDGVDPRAAVAVIDQDGCAYRYNAR